MSTGKAMQIDRYFEDFEPGQSFMTAGCSLSEAQILDFAFAYDPQPFHIDREAASRSIYGGLIASGLQTLAVAFRLVCQERIIHPASMGGGAMDEVRWSKPVRPGDTISVKGEVKTVRASASRADRGVVTIAYLVLDQHGEEVMRFTIPHILRRRPSSEGADEPAH